MKKIKISVIIPVYNAEQYIKNCLCSVLNSTEKNIEVICVDDGSTDKSLKIIEQFALKDTRIRIIRQDNLHAGVARNNGLKNAQGEYIHFLDADDWIDVKAYKQWYAIAKDTNSDVSICFHEKFDDKTKKTERNCTKLANYINILNFQKNPRYFIYNSVVPWNKIYRREFLLENRIEFDDLICANDRSFYFNVVIKAKIVSVIQEYWMHYRINNASSLVGLTRLKNYNCHFKSFEKIWGGFSEYDNNIKKMILDISIADFINFYRKSRNTEFEYLITKQLREYLQKIDISYIGKEIITKKWFDDYFYILYSNNPMMLKINNINEKIKTLEQRNVAIQPNTVLKSNNKSWLLRKIQGGILCYKQHGIKYTLQRIEQKIKNKIKPVSNKKEIDKRKNVNVIVSLTSFPARINTVYLTIDTILNQSIVPKKVILWLADSQFPNRENDLPINLLNLKKKGLIIDWCEDIRSYKKLIPTLQQYPEDIIVTADDDVYYDPAWLERLYNAYQKYHTSGNYIYCHRVTKFFSVENEWHIISASKSVYPYPTYLHKLTGVGGVLYPPHSLDADVLRKDLFMNMAPTNDDIWFWCMAIKNNYRIMQIENNIPVPKIIEGSQTVALTKVNDSVEGKFWQDLEKIFIFYENINLKLLKEQVMMKNIEKVKLIPDSEKGEFYYKNLNAELREAEIMNWYHSATKDYLYLDNPLTYNQKIQWLKLYECLPIKTKLADKFLVREWVKNKIGDKYLIPMLGVYTNPESIDFDKLPDKFVLKANHGSGWNIIVNDKNSIDQEKIKNTLRDWLNSNYGYKRGQELHYANIEPKIIAEKFIDSIDDVCDYKFLCFNGEIKYIWVDSLRYIDHRRDFFDLNWNHLNIVQKVRNADTIPKKPTNLSEMINIVSKLAKDFTHVRVDLYNVEGKIYFGEMTFSSANGTEKMTPIEFNRELGDLIQLPQEKYFPKFIHY